jgi:hypothetical protein
MKFKLLTAGIIAFFIGYSSICVAGQSGAEQQKPGEITVAKITLEAIVEAVDYDARKVTLKDTDGKTVTIDVENQVENLPQVEVGDIVEIEYIESVAIQVFAADQAEPGASTIVAAKGAQSGEKPAVVAVKETTIVVTIEAIDKKNQAVTLKDSTGESKTVKVRNPENLEKVVIGDKVMIMHTQAIGVSVTEKTSQQ